MNNSYFNEHWGNKTYIHALLIAGLLLPIGVHAQDAVAGKGAVEEVIVTGSRIARGGADAPIPTTVMDSEIIEVRGNTNISDLLTELPAIGPGNSNQSTRSNGFTFAPGVNALNLRELGIDRTLVLVNGRRQVGGIQGSTAVDLATIPNAMIDRIETITGGASAIYGADAVTGVVNVILKDKFEGVQLDIQGGATDDGDGEEQSYSILGGTSFAGGRGHIMTNYTFTKSDGARACARRFTCRNLEEGAFLNPNDTGVTFAPPPNNTHIIGIPNSNDGINNVRVAENRLFNVVGPSGLALLPGLPGEETHPTFNLVGNFPFDSRTFTFEDNGTVRPFSFGNFSNIFVSQGGDGLDIDQFVPARIPVERQMFSTVVDYEFSPLVNFHFEGRYADTESETTNQPAFEAFAGFATPAIIQLDNAFIPAALATEIANRGGAAALAAFGGGFPFLRSNEDLIGSEGRKTTAEREFYQLTFGLDGEFNNGWTYNLTLSHGETSSDIFFEDRLERNNNLSLDAVFDANGNIVCRSQLGGPTGDPVIDNCVPRNPFGRNTASAAARNYVNTVRQVSNKLEQDVASFVLTGDAYELPAGPLGFAVGAEYRKESSENTLDNQSRLGLTFDTFVSPPQNTVGSYNVKEVFAEILVPLLNDKPFVESFSMDAAVRYSDYSTIGKTTTWKFGGEWALTGDLRFRGSRAKAVRAPNVGELFAPQNNNFTFVTDPCDAREITSGPSPANRQANCAAAGAPANFDGQNGASKAILERGNPDLDPETADTFTVGMVLTPRWLPNLTVTMDYWEMEIVDAIALFPADDILTNCFDSPTPVSQNVFCDQISRFNGGAQNFQISSIVSQRINTAQLNASGIDLEVGYFFDLADVFSGMEGVVNFSGNATYLRDLENIPNANDLDAIIVQDGEIDAENATPHWQGSFRVAYQRGAMLFNWNTRFIGGASSDIDQTPEQNASKEVDMEVYTDVQLRYDFGNALLGESFGGGGNWQLFAGVNNLFDNNPPNVVGLEQGVQDGAALYPNIGRNYYAGVRVSF